MDIKTIKQKSNERQKRTVPINIRITEPQSKWLKAQGISPTVLFDAALTELGYKE